jgi:hypothetical protein
LLLQESITWTKKDAKKRKTDREKNHTCKKTEEIKKKPGLAQCHDSMDENQREKNRTGVLCLDP